MLATGELTARGLAGESVNPSFLAVDPSRRFLYAVDEVGEFDGEKTGSVSAFTIDAVERDPEPAQPAARRAARARAT